MDLVAEAPSFTLPYPPSLLPWLLIDIDALPSFPRPCRVTALDAQARHDAVEEGDVVVAFEGELDEVSGGKGREGEREGRGGE